MCMNRDDLRLHDVTNFSVIIHGHQILGSYDTDQLSAFQYVTGINGLFVDADFLDVAHGIAHGHVFFQCHIFSSHDTSGTVIRVVQQQINIVTFAAVYRVQNTGNQISRKFTQHIYGIIHIKVIKKLFQFLFGKYLYQISLHGAAHIGKYVRSFVFWNQPECNGQFLIF